MHDAASHREDIMFGVGLELVLGLGQHRRREVVIVP
jgi:hypothetical protein